MNKYIRYIKKYILLVVSYHIIIWLLVEKQGMGRHEAAFFDNLPSNVFIITITIVGSWIPNIISRLSNFIKSRKEQ